MIKNFTRVSWTIALYVIAAGNADCRDINISVLGNALEIKLGTQIVDEVSGVEWGDKKNLNIRNIPYLLDADTNLTIYAPECNVCLKESILLKNSITATCSKFENYKNLIMNTFNITAPLIINRGVFSTRSGDAKKTFSSDAKITFDKGFHNLGYFYSDRINTQFIGCHNHGTLETSILNQENKYKSLWVEKGSDTTIGKRLGTELYVEHKNKYRTDFSSPLPNNVTRVYVDDTNYWTAKVVQAVLNSENEQNIFDEIRDAGEKDPNFSVWDFNSKEIRFKSIFDWILEKNEVLAKHEKLKEMTCRKKVFEMANQLKKIPSNNKYYYEEAQRQIELLKDLDNVKMYTSFIDRANEILSKVKELQLTRAIFPMQDDVFKNAEQGSPEKMFSELSIQGFGEYLDDTQVGRIDISFENIKSFALRRLKNIKPDPITKYDTRSLTNLKYVLENFDPNKRNDVSKLVQLCLGSIFEVCTSAVDWKKVIKNPKYEAQQKIEALANTSLGYKKLLTLLTLFILKSNGINLIESQQKMFSLPKIKLIIVDQDANHFRSCCSSSSNGEISVFFSNDARDSTWFHELSHAGHALIVAGFVSGMNKNMMRAVVYASGNMPRYWEALFPMITQRKTAGDEIARQIPVDKVGSFEKSDFFKTMIDTLHNGGFDTQYVPGNSHSLADIIFFYACCFCDGKQVWDNPEEVITIYGRCPFAFTNSNGQRVFVEVVDKENQSNFVNRTILYHEGQITQLYNETLKEVFKQMGVNDISLKTAPSYSSYYSDYLRKNLDNHPQKMMLKYGMKKEDYDRVRSNIMEKNENEKN